MPKNNLCFGKYKISERKRSGKNQRIIFYLTPMHEKCANIDDYSERFLIAIRRGVIIERYPECIPNSINIQDKLEIINHIKKREDHLRNSNSNSDKVSDTKIVPDFDVFEDILDINS